MHLVEDPTTIEQSLFHFGSCDTVLGDVVRVALVPTRTPTKYMRLLLQNDGGEWL
jgi:hypothetical protein